MIKKQLRSKLLNGNLHCISLLLMILGGLTSANGQENTIGTIAYDSEAFAPGYTLIYPHNQPHARLLDACGEVVHIWENENGRTPGNSAILTPLGDLVWAHRPTEDSESPISAGGRGETIEKRNWDNELIWSFTLNDSTGRLHHDFALMNNGNVLAIAWERIDSLQVVEAGRNPENIVGGALWSERVIELSPTDSGSANIVWEWRAWDHLIQDFDSTKANFGVVSEHPERIDINYGSIGNIEEDWLHANGIDYSPLKNQILLSVPNYDELWVIDRNQPANGLVWRWGNPEAYGQGDSDDQKLYFQHSGTWLDAPYLQNSPDYGKIGVFNNRNPGTTGPYSSVHIIDPIWQEDDSSYTMDANAFLPLDFDWTWTAPVPTDFFSSGLSNFERLANGNNLILNGRRGEILELTAAGDTAWHYRVPLQNGVAVDQGTELGINANILFKARRYPLQFPAFSNVELSPLGFWELNPQPVPSCLPCDLILDLDVVDGVYAIANASGAVGQTTIEWSLDDVSLCTGDTLFFSDEDSPCQPNLDLLVTGDIVTVTAIDEQGCEISSTFIWSDVNALSEAETSLLIYPNPSTGDLTLVGFALKSRIKIRDVAGKIVWTPTVPNSSNMLISLGHLPAGWYFVETDGLQLPIILMPH